MHTPSLGPHTARRVPAFALAAVTASLAAATLALAGCASAPAANPSSAPASPAGCTVDLIAQFSPAIARPTSTAFLQGLVQGTGYDLRYVRTLGTSVLLRLSGPDPSCDGEVARLRRDAAVKSLEIDEKSYLPRVPPRTESR